MKLSFEEAREVLRINPIMVLSNGIPAIDMGGGEWVHIAFRQANTDFYGLPFKGMDPLELRTFCIDRVVGGAEVIEGFFIILEGE